MVKKLGIYTFSSGNGLLLHEWKILHEGTFLHESKKKYKKKNKKINFFLNVRVCGNSDNKYKN